MPPIHGADRRKDFLIKIHFEETGHLTSVLQALAQKLSILLLGDLQAIFEHSCKRARLRSVILGEIRTQTLCSDEQCIGSSGFEVAILSLAGDMVCCPGRVSQLLRCLLSMFCIDTVSDCLLLLKGDTLGIQLHQHLLHRFLNVGAIQGQLTFQRFVLILMKPEHNLNRTAHWDTPCFTV